MITTERKLLSDTLVEMVTAVIPAEASGLRVHSVDLDLPIEVDVRQTAGSLEFLAGVPRWRWTTDFDQRGGRLHLHCGQGELP